MTPDHTEPDAATDAEDEREAAAPHTADRPPTEEEEAAAERQGDAASPSVSEAFKKAAETGANVKGEGEI